MTAIAFDTLKASKRLREAGVEEHMAEAIVGLIRQTAELPDISDLATKSELQTLATRSELMTMKSELASEIASVEIRLGEKLRVQGWALMGGMAALTAASTALIKLVP